MTRYFTIIAFLGVFSFQVSGQNKINRVYEKFIAADSVLLVSHLTTYGPVVNETNGSHSYRLVEKNKVNYKIIKEQYLLDAKEVDSIAKTIITPNRDSIIEKIKCFMPHHGILMFKKGKCSYFDICFGCRRFVTSKDIKLSDELDDETWNALKSFFVNRNLTYELTEQEFEEE